MDLSDNNPGKNGGPRQSLREVAGHIQAGRLSEAETLCRAILRESPGEAGIHHVLGVLNHQMGKNEEARKEIESAIGLNPNDAEYHNNLGVVLLAMGKAQQALAACARAVDLRAQYPEAWNNLGNAMAAAGQLKEAISAYDRAIEQSPKLVQALNNRGNALKQIGRLDDAIAAYGRAIAQQPNYAEAHSNLGIALQMAGRRDEAIASYRAAVALQPGDGRGWIRLGSAFFDVGKFADALECFGKATAFPEVQAEAYNDIGLVLQKMGRFGDAVEKHRHALSLKADFPEALTALGAALRQNGQLDEAIACFERAASLQPRNADALAFLGAAMQEKGKLEEATSLQRRAIAIRPDHPEAHLNLAFVLLAQGKFAEGWREYEWRRRQETSERKFSCPQWQGEELSGRRILIHAEQGLGDALQFVRYVPRVRERGGKVILECYGELDRLFAQVPGVEELVKAGTALPECDLHCPMLSLPLAFGTTAESIPSEAPYLKADPELSRQWAVRFPVKETLKVGLAWAGRRSHFNDRNRSIPGALFNRLGEVEGATYFSLQKRESAASFSSPDLPMTDWTGELNDMADTAALMANLDLVICVDTAVAHLAGAMGKPCWVLLPHPADFRWLLDREDSPWYPSLRLFRQRRARDWEEPMGRVVAELKLFSK
jgi:tetratricopeptide (TPR) repeat protein